MTAIAVVSVLGLETVHAGVDVWTSEGPEGAAISVIAVDPTDAQIAYVGTNAAGVFKTTNGGSSWSAARAGLSDANVAQITIDPNNRATVLAVLHPTGVAPSRLFKSADGASSWAASDEGLGPGFISSVVIDARNPGTLYAGVTDNDGGGVFKSVNGGQSWMRVLGDTLAERRVTQIAIDPADSERVYAATRTALLKSTNAGETWDPTASWPLTDSNDSVAQIAFDPVDTRVIYMGVQGGLLPPSGVFKSANGGDSWEPTGGELGPRVSVLVAHPTVPGTLYALHNEGAFKTTNGGGRWDQMIQGLPPRRFRYAAMALAASDPQRLYFGLGTAAPAPVYRSIDGAATWEPLAVTGLTNTLMQAIAVAPDDPPARYASADVDSLNAVLPLWKSGTDPQSWTRLSGIMSSTVVAIDPSNSDIVYAGSTNDGVLKSEDAGGMWRRSNINIAGTHINCLEIDPSESRILYACSDFSLFKSTNGGALWNPIDGLQDEGASAPATVSAVAIDPQVVTTLYVASHDQGIFKSLDGGESWEGADQGLAAPAVRTLAIDPVQPNVLYAGARSIRGEDDPGGIYKSTNGGASWMDANGGESETLAQADVVDLAIDTECPQIVYAATEIGVFRSRDGATTWIPVNEGLFTRDVRALVIDPRDPAMLHAATYGGGVFTIQQSFRSGPEACPATPTPGTPSPTATAESVTPTPTTTPTRAPVACAGDCDGTGSVRVDELVRAVRIALGLAGVDTCSPADGDGDGQVRVEELVRAVQRNLRGCDG